MIQIILIPELINSTSLSKRKESSTPEITGRSRRKQDSTGQQEPDCGAQTHIRY